MRLSVCTRLTRFWEYFCAFQPQKDSLLLPAMIVCRLVFVPLFMLCNVQPRVNLPVFFHHDGWFIVFMTIFAFSNGYLASLCMCFGPKWETWRKTLILRNFDQWCLLAVCIFLCVKGVFLRDSCFLFCRSVLPHEAETAGAIMAFFLSLGLALGAALSFFFKALV